MALDAAPGCKPDTPVIAVVGALLLLVSATVALAHAYSLRPRRTVAPVGLPVAHRSPSERLGWILCSLANKRSDRARDITVGRTAVSVGFVALISPILAVLALAGVVLRSWFAARRRAQARTTKLNATLAEIIDLFAVVLQNGHNLATATRMVSQWAPGEAGQALQWCCMQSDQGERLSDALDQLPARVDPLLGPLVAALVAHDRYGAQIGPTLTLLAHDARQDHRRRAETAARRLPVAMLFPLVSCVLPSFLLLTVVPLSIQALSSMDL